MKRGILSVVFFVIMIMIVVPSAQAGGWSGGTLVSVRHYQTRTLVKMSGISNPDNCEKTTYLHLEEDGGEFARLVNADILTALAAGMSINFMIEGCSDAGYPIITQSWLGN